MTHIFICIFDTKYSENEIRFQIELTQLEFLSYHLKIHIFNTISNYTYKKLICDCNTLENIFDCFKYEFHPQHITSNNKLKQLIKDEEVRSTLITGFKRIFVKNLGV